MRRIIRTLVTDLAENIYECSDGAQAVTAYAAQQPEWVLMDIELPILDGLTATRLIKQAFPAAHIVIVSHYGDERMRAAAVRAGASHFVGKENLLQLRDLLSAQSPEQKT